MNLQDVFRRIDQINEKDERRITDVETGQTGPHEIVYSRRMLHWLSILSENPSDELRIAVYAQHIGRFHKPRNTYPEGRTGYLQWKTALLQYHAELASGILADAGASPEFIARVAKLLRKQGLGRDPETQLLEDCACLVFLELFYADFAPTQDREKMAGIVKKTLLRMSDSAKARAMQLPAAEHVKELLSGS